MKRSFQCHCNAQSITYIPFTQCAAVAGHTFTLKVVEPIQTGGAVETGVRRALVYICLTPETYQQSFNTTMPDRTRARLHTRTHTHTLGCTLEPSNWFAVRFLLSFTRSVFRSYLAPV